MAFWCVNLDGEAGPLGNQPPEFVVVHGLQEQLWMMHYQYSHNGHTYQGHPNQVAATTTNWRAVGTIKPADWLVAYLPSSRFFAVGEVIPRRNRGRYLNQQLYKDTIQRTTTQKSHVHLQGIVDYADADALYEDFTDAWNLPLTNAFSQLPEVWQYPQRIDVEDWLHIVRCGVQVKGLATHVPVYTIQRAVFEIPKSFFGTIIKALQQAAQG